MMAKYPEVVEQAHVEIDSILHQEHLPTFEDRKSLPIVDCIMKEVFRYVFSFFITSADEFSPAS